MAMLKNLGEKKINWSASTSFKLSRLASWESKLLQNEAVYIFTLNHQVRKRHLLQNDIIGCAYFFNSVACLCYKRVGTSMYVGFKISIIFRTNLVPANVLGKAMQNWKILALSK